MYFFENYEIVTFLSAIGQYFHKSEKNPLGRHHRHKKSKQILKLCISTIDVSSGVLGVSKLKFGGLVC